MECAGRRGRKSGVSAAGGRILVKVPGAASAVGQGEGVFPLIWCTCGHGGLCGKGSPHRAEKAWSAPVSEGPEAPGTAASLLLVVVACGGAKIIDGALGGRCRPPDPLSTGSPEVET
ncbi:hypothetical protein NDU88_001534 [Pleurodeles waltl]|uniref:Uncharacterized protein n=1 Tax=Pleurodeles waltl TaxID=8319 RepID=A0AAV7MNP9_PLEWA|nr:hypothetical protein NDU88_001534 [Pleurodeles waltl]